MIYNQREREGGGEKVERDSGEKEWIERMERENGKRECVERVDRERERVERERGWRER